MEWNGFELNGKNGFEWIEFELHVKHELFAGISMICLISVGKHRP